MFGLFKKKSTPPPAPSLDDVDLHLEEIPGAVTLVEGYPRIDWPKVNEAVKPYADHPAIDHIWTELAAQWLSILQRHLRDPYQIYEGNHLLLLSADGPTEARGMTALGDAAYDRLEKLLHLTSAERGHGKHVVLMLRIQSEYYDYISHFYSESEREYGTSAGVHIKAGYHHTVINGKSHSKSRTLVHEMAHNMVAARPIPKWLNEGLAQSVEDMVPQYRAPLIDHRQAALHRRYWGWFGVDHFWKGRGFSSSSAQRLHYQLADILFRNLANHRTRGRKLHDFLATAHHQDFGAEACRQCFDCSLSDLAAEFLGPGDWNPKSPETPVK